MTIKNRLKMAGFLLFEFVFSRSSDRVLYATSFRSMEITVERLIFSLVLSTSVLVVLEVLYSVLMSCRNYF